MADEEDLAVIAQETPTPEPGETPTPPEEVVEPAESEIEELEPEIVPEPEPVASARESQLAAEKWEERRRAEAAEARAKRAEETLAEVAKLDPNLVRPQGDTPQAGRRFTADDLRSEAMRIAHQQQFDNRVNEAVLAGRKAYTDYDQAIDGLKRVTGAVVPSEFVAAALETGEATEIIYALGKNPSEADRVLSLPPLKQAIELERMASKMRADKAQKVASGPAVSKAPVPIPERVGPRGSTKELSLNDPKLPLAEFIRRRNEEEQKARKRA